MTTFSSVARPHLRGRAKWLGLVWVSASMALASAWMCAPAVAYAQTAADLETARELYKGAREQREKGDVAGSLEKFRAANALAQTPITGLELGRTFMMLGRLIEARDAFLAVGRLKVKPDESENAAAARQDAADLAEKVRMRIGSLLIIAPKGVSVRVDGEVLPEETLGHPRKVDPGPHEIVASAGKTSETRAVNVGEGKTVEVEFKGMEVPAASDGATASRPLTDRMGPVFFGGAGVAGAGFVLGSLSGIAAIAKSGEASDLCVESRCRPEAESVVSTGRTWATISTVSYAAMLIGVGVAAVGLFVVPPEPKVKRAARRKTVVAIDHVYVAPISIGGTFE
jgi:hypothetical protein